MRPILILMAVLLALWLPSPDGVPSAGAGPVEASGPGESPEGVVVLPASPGRYGNLQHVRTPLPPRSIALTFDDGPDPTYLPRVLDILDVRGIKATFFFVGVYAERRPDLVREVTRRGHNVASHSWSHPTRLRYWSPAEAHREIRRGFAALDQALAESPPEQRARLEPMFRFPGLNESPALARWLGDRGILVVSAEGGTDDWRGLGADAILRRTVSVMEASGGGVLILHETRPRMIEALPALLDTLTARGFTFVQITAGPEGRARAVEGADPLFRP
ncbi:polysaccharide deacetylase family protein [Brevundimonas sp.]|uniref:polysaccharide deacetylase family protein n=1 Tax=Brevundimonas sp. TaxID=1871086 RepID=UPI003AF76C1E